jgi:pyruvate/2-oxoglutarate dehydrogenase complex dihydrolipoamide acyltransferase (E2) component
MSTMASLQAAGRRIRATPYARRLARDRNLLLADIVGSGPNGRITGDDLNAHRPQAVAAEALPVAQAAAPAPIAPVTIVAVQPAAIVSRVEFSALETLLEQIRALEGSVSREDICLKAAARALEASNLATADDGMVLLSAPDRRQKLGGVAQASVSAIAAIRERAPDSGNAALAVSFLGRPGVRPVAARLVEGVHARLVVGAAEKDGSADCLLSYDPAKIGDDQAEEFLVTFRSLVETPFRLLV